MITSMARSILLLFVRIYSLELGGGGGGGGGGNLMIVG